MSVVHVSFTEHERGRNERNVHAFFPNTGCNHCSNYKTKKKGHEKNKHRLIITNNEKNY